ncbi:hypothetical protein DOE73_16490 [Paenibacillus dendritiformis]|nr:hypothetical protein DOE73_16490 [Paenibacillus dendritiformis]
MSGIMRIRGSGVKVIPKSKMKQDLILIIQNMNLPIDEIGSIISREFRVQVYYGQVSYERDGRYTYIVSKEWNR